MSQPPENVNLRPVGTGRRPLFVRQIDNAAADLGIQSTWHSDFWVTQLTKDTITKYIIATMFPLNNAAAAQLASDKVATAAVLNACGLPIISHRLLRFIGMEPAEWTHTVLDGAALPLVVKPHKESAGIDVYRATTHTELHDVLTFLAQRYWAAAVSPFVDITDEYRVVVLGRDVNLIYRKVRSTKIESDQVTEWRHNLHLGAHPELLGGGELYNRLSVIAVKAIDAMDLAFAAVDIVTVRDQLQILEVNSSVTLERFSQHSTEYAEIALAIYRNALRASFAL